MYGLVFPQDSAVRDAIGSQELWMLAQRRHVIVHTRGVVAQRYLDNTGDKMTVGDELVLTPNSVERYAFAIQEAATAMITAGGSSLRTGP